MDPTSYPTAGDATTTSTTPFVATAVLKQARSLTLNSFQDVFDPVYTHLSGIDTSDSHIKRAHLTFGVVMTDDSELSVLPTPEYRLLTETGVRTISPDDIETADLYVSFFADEVPDSIDGIQEAILTEILRTVVVSNSATQQLPVDEAQHYEQILTHSQNKN